MKLIFPSYPSCEFDLVESDLANGAVTASFASAENDGSLADYIEGLAFELLTMIEKHPGEVRPFAVKTAGSAFRAAAEIGIGLDDPQFIFESIASWDTEAAAHVFTAFPLTQGMISNKRFAVEVSDILSYEEGQEFYRFTTLVTKLIE